MDLHIDTAAHFVVIIYFRCLVLVNFYPRDAMIAHVLYSYGPVSVCLCLSQVGVLSNRLNESGWFWVWELPSTYPTLCFKEIQVSSKNKGTSLWNFVPNSGLRKFRHSISIVETCYNLAREWTLRAW